VITQLVEKHVSRGSATPSQAGGAQRSQILWDLLYTRTQYEKQKPNYCTEIKLDVKNIYRIDHECCRTIFCGS